MALRIFDTDPDARPKPRAKSPDIAYQLKSGTVVGSRPRSLSEWRVLAASPQIAAAVAELYGGQPREWDPTKELGMEVMTSTSSIPVVVSEIDERLIQWGPRGPIHECDGEFFLSPDPRAGSPCGCPPTLRERKAAHRAGTGPGPWITISLRMADDYHLGAGRYIATSWSFVEVYLPQAREDLDRIDGEALCDLSIERVQYTTKSGMNVDFNRPSLTVQGSWNEAIAEDA